MHDGHEHTHTHGHVNGPVDKAETVALARFLLEHNEHHTAELAGLSDQLEALGLHDAAHGLLHAAEEYQKGNERLKAALSSIPE